MEGCQSGGKMEGCQSGGQMEGCPSGGQIEGCQSGGQMEGCPSGGQMEGCLSGGQMEGCPSGGQMEGGAGQSIQSYSAAYDIKALVSLATRCSGCSNLLSASATSLNSTTPKRPGRARRKWC